MRLFLCLLQAIETVINFRVRLEYVHCESNEGSFNQVQQLTTNECQKRSVKGKQKVQFKLARKVFLRQ